ncbi:uncharacterized protein [Epargyreus clarus]|uniref:uncharacterized protein n=1 Tax=Epargyreus clarus TaxID=520877 RepID=UPI003C2CDD01
MSIFYITVAVLAVVAQAYSQCIPPCASALAPVYSPGCGCGCGPALVAAPPLVAPAPIVTTPTVIQPNSVAATLADTLSLLTVSSLLAEKLPYGCPLCGPSIYPGCGCGCGYGYVL